MKHFYKNKLRVLKNSNLAVKLTLKSKCFLLIKTQVFNLILLRFNMFITTIVIF